MRVIVCGSRGWSDFDVVWDRLSKLPPDTMIVVGYDPARDGPSGADRYAYAVGLTLGLEIETYPADWEALGKPAGYIRNREMADLGADLCIAFWDGESKGTMHMMGLARDRGISVEVVYP